MLLALIIKGKIYGLNLTSSISVFIFWLLWWIRPSENSHPSAHNLSYIVILAKIKREIPLKRSNCRSRTPIMIAQTLNRTPVFLRICSIAIICVQLQTMNDLMHIHNCSSLEFGKGPMMEKYHKIIVFIRWNQNLFICLNTTHAQPWIQKFR